MLEEKLLYNEHIVLVEMGSVQYHGSGLVATGCHHTGEYIIGSQLVIDIVSL